MKIRGQIKNINAVNANIGDTPSPYTQKRTWVVVADQQRARVFKRINSHVEQIGEMSATPYAEIELTRNTIGQAGAPGKGSHAYEPSMEESRQVPLAFAREIDAWLDKAAGQKAFDNLILIAAPRTLGDLRESLSKTVKSKVVNEFDKDLTNFAPGELEREIMRYIMADGR
jgi:protein required for attachment to host cells